MQKTKWAIVGTGYIANQFATGMQVVEDADLVAVVSRKEETAKTFAEKYGAKTVYTDYDKMLNEEAIDAVYIGIPNDCHYEYIMKALDKKIPVLSEKPMVDCGWQLENVLNKAVENDTFLMEGMWTRCFPVVRKVREWIAEGKIGEVHSVRASFDFKANMNDWQPWKGGIRHAGGALRDVGIYSLAMAYMVFPEGPVQVASAMESNGEVDESCHLLLIYEGGKAAFVSGAFNQSSTPEVEIVGDKGRIIIGPEMWHPRKAELIYNDGTKELTEDDYPASGFQYEIQAVQECLKNGEKDCKHFTHEESRKIGGLIEETRKVWGIVYAADEQQ